MPHKICVVAAVIERLGSYLICQRPLEKRHGGLWEFPGGKLRDGESLEDAASRKLAEELGIKAQTVGKPLFSLQDPGSDFVITFCLDRLRVSVRPWRRHAGGLCACIYVVKSRGGPRNNS